MPAESKAQLRYAYAVKNGDVEADAETKRWANEVISKTKTTKGLPEKKASKKVGTKRGTTKRGSTGTRKRK